MNRINECRICRNENNNKMYETHEKMFGYGDNFIYFQCSKCECLQILEFPKHISKYYPNNYCSFTIDPVKQAKSQIKNRAVTLRDTYAIFNKSFIGKLIYMRFPNETLQLLSKLKLTTDTKILDVGCGSGNFLYSIYKLGLTNSIGIDPFLEEDLKYENGLRILRRTIHDIGEKWDLIIFNHSLEHISDQLGTLKVAAKLLNEEGVCFIRIPIINSYAWEKYGKNWAQLDAPRHFFIHSINSIKILAAKANLKLEKIIFDSNAQQFWGSIQFLKGIPLKSERSYSQNPSKSIFTKKDIRTFTQKARKLNHEGRGDQAAFYFKKK